MLLYVEFDMYIKFHLQTKLNISCAQVPMVLIVLRYSLCLRPPKVVAGGIMFSGCPSVRLSVRPSVRASVRQSVRPSVTQVRYRDISKRG